MTTREKEEAHEYNVCLLANIRRLCVERSTSITKIEKALNYGNGSISGWYKAAKKAPRERVEAIAVYLDVPVGCLISQQETPVPTTSENGHTEAQIEIIRLVLTMTDRELEILLTTAKALIATRQ